MGAQGQPLGTGAVSFGRPVLLWLALALPLALVLAVLAWQRRRRAVARALGESALVRRLGATGIDRFPWPRLLLLAIAGAALGLSAADPRWGTESVETHGRSLSMVLALDVSRSMYAQDVKPDRLERERIMSRMLLRELPGDRIGVVVFAGRAYVLSPLTGDHSALELYLDALGPDMVSQGGTSLASAIGQAVDLVRERASPGADRVVVLMTDGEALEDQGQVTDAARNAASAGVTIETVGLGTTAGAPVPDEDPTSTPPRGYKRDPASGQVVISRLDPTLLQQVARITHGDYVQLEQPGATSALLATLRALHRSEGPAARHLQQKEQYEWFVAISLACLALDALLGRVRARRQAATLAHERVAPEAARGEA